MVTRHDRGSATVLLLAVVVLASFVVVGAARLGAALSARARAETAADAAALAAADALALGDDDATERARAIAKANGGRLLECRCSGTSAEVLVEVAGPSGAGLPGPARARARAEIDLRCAWTACERATSS